MFKGIYQFLANHVIPCRRKNGLFVIQKIPPGMDTTLPKLPFGFKAYTLDVNKGVFNQGNPFQISNTKVFKHCPSLTFH